MRYSRVGQLETIEEEPPEHAQPQQGLPDGGFYEVRERVAAYGAIFTAMVATMACVRLAVRAFL